MTRRQWSPHLAGKALAPQPRLAAHSPRRRAAFPAPTREQLQSLDDSIPSLQVLDIDLMGAPRMTRRDQWVKRPCVLRYRAQCDHLRLAGCRLPMRYVAVVFLAMPASWSATQRRRQAGAPHLSKPDKDNVEKGLLDALCPSDAHLWDGRLQKRWGWKGTLLLFKGPIEEAVLDRLVAQHAPQESFHAR